MSGEDPHVQVAFVKIGEDGKVERTHRFAPWDPQQQPVPGVEPSPGSAERPTARHVSYDDPPGVNITPDQYRAMLAFQVHECGDLETFVMVVARILINDNVAAHGVSPHDAIPAVMEFVTKVYAELSGTV